MSRVNQRVEEWKRKVVDLSRRNRLLYFARSRGSTIKITEPLLPVVFDRLVKAERAWKFKMPPDLPKAENGTEEDSSQLSSAPGGQEDESQAPTPKPSPTDRRSDELVADIEDGARLRSMLRTLYRRSRTDFEERGVRILFLAVGMLEWEEMEQSETVKSPILLLPVELKRESVNDPFQLFPVDEEIVINPALAVKLGDDFKVELPSVPEDWETASVRDYLTACQAAVGKYGWTVRNYCWLALFSFHKLVIYHDLKNHTELLNEHPIVRLLCDEEKETLRADLVEASDLDSKTGPDTSFLVADADSSQLVCIESVKAGSNLVIQGPPGTGKSQTITNLISEMIARGKSVLFVSEKMAALEVVFKRLQKAQLGHFCLQLHSYRASKREVIQELYKTYGERLQPQKGLTELEARQLIERRKKLNDYVHSLHLVRRPLGCSAYEALGSVSRLEGIPYVPAGAYDASRLTPEGLDGAEQLAGRLEPVWEVAVSGPEFPWFGCSLTAFSFAVKADLQAAVEECMRSVSSLQGAAVELARRLGLPVPVSPSDAEWLLETSSLLQTCPGIEREWVVNSNLDELRSDAERYLRLSNKYKEHRKIADTVYSPGFLSIPGDLRGQMKKSVAGLESYLKRPLAESPAFVSERESLCEWAEDFSARLGSWLSDGESVLQSVGLHGTLNIKRLRQLVRIADLCRSEDRPDETWFEIQKLREVMQSLPSIREGFDKREEARRTVLADYEEGILDLQTEDLIERFSGPYSSILRFLRPGYYRSKRQMKRLRKDGQLPGSILADLRKVQALKELEAQLVSKFPAYEGLLGGSFRGFETDFGRIGLALSVADELVELAGVQPMPEQIVRQASAQGLATLDLRVAAERLRQSMDEGEKRLQTAKPFLPPEFWDGSGLPIEEKPLAELKSWTSELAVKAGQVKDLIDNVLSCKRSGGAGTCRQIDEDLARLEEMRSIERHVEADSARLQGRFGKRFAGMETIWDEALGAIDWVSRFRNHLGDGQVPEALMSVVVAGKAEAPPNESIANGLERLRAGFKSLSVSFYEGFPAVGGTPILQADFAMITGRLSEMQDRIEALRDWVDFKAIEAAFLERGLAELFKNLTSRAESIPAEDIPKAVRRSLLQAWLNRVFQEDPCLGTFRGENHERLIAEFRDLDRKHWEQGVHSVIREVNRHRPASSFVIPGGEVQVLFREANKQRRHLALRKLFGIIPNLLTQIKPCLLMSPISVSQFLDPEKTKFDVVIFDEASQLRSEDAICSVYRGKQLVVCGDNRQLPPTAFFEQGMSDELPDETDDPEGSGAFDVFDSILDACAAVLPQRQLKWHYRSEHESLIAFSNSIFYDYSLITFPSWLQEDEELGVKFVHVPEGVYDRGGRRDNVREAERVVSLVEDHFRRFPEQSLGIVTFNMAQAETIENHLEQFRLRNPELERYFALDRPETFFVKSLESVQGDERDVLIFSVGYGKDKFGRLTMNFGPLNSAGGERRLNVAVTRARKKVVVVSSIRASDFDLREVNREGVRALQKYLDFAERGPDALQLQVGEGEFESPLEQSVAAAIRSMGFDVVPQVGCSSFRVDLGVIDPGHPGRFALGVECDGASYHSSATARDRDRLRQQILERLGWRIYRIWSPDWVTRRQTEVDRLKTAIETALRDRDKNLLAHSPRTSGRVYIPEVPAVVENEIPRVDEKFVIPEWVKAYRVCEPSRLLRLVSRPDLQFHDPRALPDLTRMVSQIVKVEGPVHVHVVAARMAKAWGLDRVGDRMTDAARTAWYRLWQEKSLRFEGDFLWPAMEDFRLAVRQPDPQNKLSRRSIEEISPKEIAMAIKNLVRDSLSVDRDRLLVYVARILGFERTGNHIQQALEGTFNKLVKTRQLVLSDGRVSLPN